MEEKKVFITYNDITKMNCDCIVNAANSSLLGGGGVDGAIHEAAGMELYKECLTLNGCNTGEAKITKGYNLKAKHIIHTVGPIYSNSKSDPILLSNCYRNSLNLARDNKIQSIAFPAISTGVYNYPLDEAMDIAITTSLNWLNENLDYKIKIIFCCYSEYDYEKYIQYCKENKVEYEIWR